ncbi:hypothetical protein N0O92_14445 [Alkalihalobacillus sp. MEB130]|uniref:hypothetical protein n=1 Tax=Alkalihalobacillus sp. MEB130 TaxID=2976704 RepID=UPI0028E062F3|nr:hypothetical protein [Alkalihalobacillus sp. MEB130]MDT8861417.1 hypothetical protein [Alkalihalobacillus sp. MEB130]
MYRGKAFCEARMYLHSQEDTLQEEQNQQIKKMKSYLSNTVKVTDIKIHTVTYDPKEEEYVTSLSVMAEVLVKYDPIITHLNDYRVNACREFRKQFPQSGAVMAHSIDTFSPFRPDGFITRG